MKTRAKQRAADKERAKREVEEQDDQHMAYEDALLEKWAEAKDPREAQLLAGIDGGAALSQKPSTPCQGPRGPPTVEGQQP